MAPHQRILGGHTHNECADQNKFEERHNPKVVVGGSNSVVEVEIQRSPRSRDPYIHSLVLITQPIRGADRMGVAR